MFAAVPRALLPALGPAPLMPSLGTPWLSLAMVRVIAGEQCGFWAYGEGRIGQEEGGVAPAGG